MSRLIVYLSCIRISDSGCWVAIDYNDCLTTFTVLRLISFFYRALDVHFQRHPK